MRSRAPLLLLLAAAACGSSKKADPAVATSAPADSAQPAASTAPAGSEAPPPPAAKAIPTACHVAGSDVCTPEPGFVSRLCDGNYPDAALSLFASSAQFTRMYLKGDVDGWNADGGKSARARLRFDEEVMVLKRRTPPKNGPVVGSGMGFLVMRWDGNCYTLEDGELATKRPASPKHAPLQWHVYDTATKDALLKSAKVLTAFQKRGKECKGAMSGDVSKACEVADAALADAVVDEVRKGIALPAPSKIP